MLYLTNLKYEAFPKIKPGTIASVQGRSKLHYGLVVEMVKEKCFLLLNPTQEDIDNGTTLWFPTQIGNAGMLCFPDARIYVDTSSISFEQNYVVDNNVALDGDNFSFLNKHNGEKRLFSFLDGSLTSLNAQVTPVFLRWQIAVKDKDDTLQILAERK